jgi:hypothetical protein
MGIPLSLRDIARGTIANAEFLGIDADLKRLDGRIAKLLREGHGGACKCPACLAAGPISIAEFVADLLAFRWLFKRRVYFGPTWLLTDAEARLVRPARKKGDGQPPRRSSRSPSPSPSSRSGQPARGETAATVPLTSAVPSIEVGAEPKSPQRKKAA